MATAVTITLKVTGTKKECFQAQIIGRMIQDSMRMGLTLQDSIKLVSAIMEAAK